LQCETNELQIRILNPVELQIRQNVVLTSDAYGGLTINAFALTARRFHIHSYLGRCPRL